MLEDLLVGITKQILQQYRVQTAESKMPSIQTVLNQAVLRMQVGTVFIQ